MQVALVGSAPSSMRLAPFGDPNWSIWGCSPGVYGVATRVDAWFEMHLWEPGQPWFTPEYVQWLTALPGRGVALFTGGEIDAIPDASVYPFDSILDEFDPHRWFCTSSLFWMMALAMRRGATKIGLWGVDMAANDEYEMQRAGIHHLAYIAQSRGIEVGCPPEADLFTPRFRYGADEWTHAFRKARVRKAELEARRAEAQNMARQYQDGEKFLAGAIDNMKYMTDTWVDKSTHLGPTSSPAYQPIV